MSLDELISVTNKAVNSLVRSDSGGQQITQDLGSPFDSPRSFRTLTDINESQNNSDTSSRLNASKSKTSDQVEKSISSLSQSLISSKGKTKDSVLTEFDHSENVTVIEIIPLAEKAVNEDINTNCSYGNEKEDNVQKHTKNVSKSKDVISDDLKEEHRSKFSKYDTHCHIQKERAAFNYSPSPSLNKADVCIERKTLTGDQPEIIDIHEKVIAVVSGSSEGSTAKLDEKVKMTSAAASDDFFRQYLGRKTHSEAVISRPDETESVSSKSSRHKVIDDVHISHFGLTEKQRDLKQALAKRSENKKPVKKFVQTKIVRSKIVAEEETDQHSGKSQADAVLPSSSSAAITAAAAASAAVAAAQPLLKIQHELETKIGQLITQISDLQEQKSTRTGGGGQDDSGERIQWLEKQMAELNERRMEHLENLQRQQFHMQAQLFSMSRSRNRSPGSHFTSTHQPQSSYTSNAGQILSSHISQSGDQARKEPADQRAGLALIDSKSQYAGYSRDVSSKGEDYNSGRRSRPYYNPETISKHHSYLNEVRELQGSHLDTPAPRDKVPKPAPYTLLQEPSKNLGFLEEILNHKDTPTHDTTFEVKGGYSSSALQDLDRNNSARGRRSEKSPVDKARRLVDTLSNLEHETAASIWGDKTPAKRSITVNHAEPAPLDHYLNYPQNEGTPYPKLHHRHHSRERKLMETNLDNLSEAKAVLKQLEMTRENLESNIQQVMRSRRDVFSALSSASVESQIEEQKKIELMVNRKISSLQEDIQREVLRGLAQKENDEPAAKVEASRQKTVARKSSTKQEISRGKAQSEYMARLATSKPSVSLSSGLASKGKENKMSKVKPPPKVTSIKDEKVMVRTYGKPEYQRGRTTIRDPYLHFKNPKSGRTARPTPMNESFVSGDGKSLSPQRRQREDLTESPTPRQFYFSPTRGYIPLCAGDSAPIPGHMIPMAIPLGQPRMEPGVRRSALLLTGSANPVTSTPVPVTAAGNVTLVSFPVDEDKKKKGREPELAKQVLPPIDIDSISPSSSQRSDIHIRSPQQGNVNMTFLQDTQDKSELDLDRTMMEDNSLLEQLGEGIQLPGYEPKIPEYSGPEFPPATRKPGPGWTAGEGQVRSTLMVSDVMAEDLRRRDVLENNAIYWLEQELIARVLSNVIPLQPQAVAADDMEKSDVSDKEDSVLVADMIGQSGLQVFIDAGQPVDNALVQALIKEVIQEKVSSMLAQKSADGQTQAGEVKDRPGFVMVDEEKTKEPLRVPTPQPTPPASPVSSPVRAPPARAADIATPPDSPPPAGHKFRQTETVPEPLLEPDTRWTQPPPPPVPDHESETETSVSIDISEELRRVAGKNVPANPEEPVIIRHDVNTPPLSPTPQPPAEPLVSPQKISTPPTSPRIQMQTVIQVNQKEAVRRLEEEEEDREQEEEEEETFEQDQPKPILMSVAVGKDGPMTLDMPDSVKSRSPSPKMQEPPGSPDHLSSLSSDSDLTETINEVFSDGQWLLSEGQVIGLPMNEAKRRAFLNKSHQYVGDVSTASTLRDTEDLALDETDFPKSEGEIIFSGLPAPEEDSMLDLFAEMQRNPFDIVHKDLPVSHVRQILSGPRPKEVMSSTGRSLGEISLGQVPPSKLAVEARNGVKDAGERQSSGDSYEKTPYLASVETVRRADDRVKQHSRTPSPPASGSSRSPSPKQKSRLALPNQRSGRSSSPQKRQQPDPRSRPRAPMPYQPVLSEGAPLPTRGRAQPGYGHRSSDSWLSQNSDPGLRGSRTSYLTESISRSADSPSFRRTGEGAILTSSLKSKNSIGLKKSVEFDLSGTYDRSRDSSGTPADPGNSFRMTYSFEESLDDSELKNLVQSSEYRPGPYRMSVTIPSSADGADSDLSEIDLTNS